MKVQAIRENGKIKMKSGFHPDLAQKAKQLGGKWDGGEKCWIFDERDDEHVKKLYMRIYGDDGETTQNLVDVRITVVEELSECCGAIYACGKILAKAFGRDSGAKVGDGVKLLKGKIDSGGSMKNWRTIIGDGSVFELRDVTERAAKVEFDKYNSETYKVEIIAQCKINLDALTAEKERLLQRLTEIEELLKAA